MYEVKMPRLGVTMQSGTITQWLVEEGEEVKKGEYLFELETEKSNLEIEAQESGVLKKILVETDTEVPVNTVVAIVAAEDEEVDLTSYLKKQEVNTSEKADRGEERKEVAVKSEEQRGSRGGVSPRARKLAKEMGVLLEDIKGTGKNGVITEDDVRSSSPADQTSIKVKETIELNNIQKAMAENMLKNWQSTPQFTQMVSVNMTNALTIKSNLEGISINDIIVKAVSRAVEKYPYVNSKLENNSKVTVYEDVNMAIAVNSSHGLVVPVIRNSEKKSVQEISREIKDLADKAENKSLTMEEYKYGTITVSNLGSLGIETGTPIINSPQSTIIFAGAVRKTPVVDENDEIIVAPIMVLSVCYNHRFIDGVKGAEFTNAVKNVIENLKEEDLT